MNDNQYFSATQWAIEFPPIFNVIPPLIYIFVSHFIAMKGKYVSGLVSVFGNFNHFSNVNVFV